MAQNEQPRSQSGRSRFLAGHFRIASVENVHGLPIYGKRRLEVVEKLN